jgi:hypothetical protein
LFARSSSVQELLLQAFSFPSTLGKVTLHPHCQACFIIYSSCGRWVFPPLLWSFLPPPLSQAFPLLLAGHAYLLPPEPLRSAWLVYLQSREGFPSPNLWRSGCPTLFSACLYCSYCLLVSFSFFPGWRSVCSRVLCCSGLGLSVGVPRYHEAHLVRVFPSHLGVGDLRPGGPPGFSI